jgi:exodeoxyribonuclease VII large subunit
MLIRRVTVVSGRPAFAGFAGRLSMRGRYAAELTHGLAKAVLARVAGQRRRVQQIERQLGAFDLGRRLASIRTRLVGADGGLREGVSRRRHRAVEQLRDQAGRLEALSPLAVLGRGYAVCWNEDRTRILRVATEVAIGDRVHVTLSRGELSCDVHSTAPSHRSAPKRDGEGS